MQYEMYRLDTEFLDTDFVPPINPPILPEEIKDQVTKEFDYCIQEDHQRRRVSGVAFWSEYNKHTKRINVHAFAATESI